MRKKYDFKTGLKTLLPKVSNEKELKTKKFSTLIEDYPKDEKKYDFICCENTEIIEIGDNFLFFFGGIADVQKCNSENEKFEINENDHKRTTGIDFVTEFWRNCYKIISTTYDLEKVYFNEYYNLKG